MNYITQTKNIFYHMLVGSVLASFLMVLVSPQVVQAATPSFVDRLRVAFSFQGDAAQAAPGTYATGSFPVSADTLPKYEMWVLATAYSSDPAQTDDTPCIPAMWRFDLCEYYAVYERADTIAANFLPLGTQVQFVDVDELPHISPDMHIVRDRMNKKYNGQPRVDVWMPSKAQAVEFGARWIKMEVYPYRK